MRSIDRLKPAQPDDLFTAAAVEIIYSMATFTIEYATTERLCSKDDRSISFERHAKYIGRRLNLFPIHYVYTL